MVFPSLSVAGFSSLPFSLLSLSLSLLLTSEDADDSFLAIRLLLPLRCCVPLRLFFAAARVCCGCS